MYIYTYRVEVRKPPQGEVGGSEHSAQSLWKKFREDRWLEPATF